jgi:hypothetical protein
VHQLAHKFNVRKTALVGPTANATKGSLEQFRLSEIGLMLAIVGLVLLVHGLKMVLMSAIQLNVLRMQADAQIVSATLGFMDCCLSAMANGMGPAANASLDLHPQRLETIAPSCFVHCSAVVGRTANATKVTT